MKKPQFTHWLFHEGRFNSGFNSFTDAVCLELNEFRVGLHAGRTFTVMGTAVNRTARPESLANELDSPILFSGDFNTQKHNTGHFMGVV